ncbi:putative Vegetative incompatibility protein HET-E-1 [Glarea lozoyensis 74030]|uniref:Putative Vegetative incompatibility protein HET-E-1 n=1 Tax=Glarea lozoyensis (strain ATCC 74030 / MF5533) TaxID=1104152 RepID=H0EU53_GLAL7|nr:putative Vegetative incompatibility protein HET-E-1 [Glarea lozoyensis 74030]
MDSKALGHGVEANGHMSLLKVVEMFDCMYPALFNNQPYVSKAETTNCAFPCAEEFWEVPTAESWKSMLGSADAPPVTYYLHALNACLLRRYIKPPPPVTNVGSEFGKLVLIYALHTHIFEWRQSTSMLNPTGLGGYLGGQALPMGKGLKERRQWLADGVESWGECYQGIDTSTAAALLHRLAFVALDVSLSDMHLVAGRSNNLNDGNFAEDNLMHYPAYKSKLGYTKISMTCQLAREDGLHAELSEAINSMYQWYKKAEKCYAYLFDLDSTPTWRKRLPQCRWFSRGWTLQELIAPMDVWFYDGKWNLVFRKGEDSHLLKRITGIHQDVLKGSRSMLSMSIAQRMSWASRRVTTRAEDEAYCLLGIQHISRMWPNTLN